MVPPGLGGFGDVGEARLCFNKLAAGMERWRQVEDTIEHDTINAEKYIKELAVVVKEMLRATDAMFEQEHRRFINMYMTASMQGGRASGGVHTRPAKPNMEHKVVQNLPAVNGCKVCSSNGTRSSLQLWAKSGASIRR